MAQSKNTGKVEAPFVFFGIQVHFCYPVGTCGLELESAEAVDFLCFIVEDWSCSFCLGSLVYCYYNFGLPRIGWE